jgi:hypothetical protein
VEKEVPVQGGFAPVGICGQSPQGPPPPARRGAFGTRVLQGAFAIASYASGC